MVQCVQRKRKKLWKERKKDLTEPVLLEMDVYRWIAKRFFKFDIAQFFYFRQFLPNAIGIALDVGVLRAGNRDFRRRRCAEVQGLTDEIARIKREMHTRK